jgi:hypothetical protein
MDFIALAKLVLSLIKPLAAVTAGLASAINQLKAGGHITDAQLAQAKAEAQTAHDGLADALRAVEEPKA